MNILLCVYDALRSYYFVVIIIADQDINKPRSGICQPARTAGSLKI